MLFSDRMTCPEVIILILACAPAILIEGCGDDGTGGAATSASSSGAGSTSSSASSGSASSGSASSGSGSASSSPITVGGGVTGLRGSGLALSLNGGSPINVDGPSFVFPATLKDGEAFAISATGQPTSPTQTCTVDGNATGTARAGVNVDAHVTCVTNVYAVGGKVNGLVGTGLVVRNNGAPLTIAPTGGSDVVFAFPTKLESGATYAVTVDANPVGPGQTCSVDAEGAGVVGAADITDVTITCAVEAYRVGGVVKGLVGSGLLLRVNSQTIDVVRPPESSSADVPFAAPSKIASGASYLVSVDKQPRSPEQTCVIDAGHQGRVATNDTSNVVVSCTTNAYSVGGQVTGLLGTGLVLRNNGQTLVVGGGPDVPFKFPTKVASGTPYAVTVDATPSGPVQACSVDARGAGTVTSAHITDVLVSCSTHAYSVGGRVRNINPVGSGITLRNGTEALFVPPAIGPDAPFAFVSKLVSGTSYNVTVDPSPYDICQIKSPTGSVSSSDITTIDVGCSPVVAPPTLKFGTFPLYAIQGGGTEVRRLNSAGATIAPSPFVNLLSTTDDGPRGYGDIDASGNLYVPTTGGVNKVTPGGVVSLFGPATASLAAAFDSLGNLYVTLTGGTTVRKIDPSGAIATNFVTGLSGVVGVAVDSSDNIYITRNTTVLAYRPNGSPLTSFGTAGVCSFVGGPGGRGMTFDAAGNLYVARQDFGVWKIVPGCTAAPTRLAQNGITEDVVFDRVSGDLYSTNTGNDIVRISLPSGTVTTFASLGANFGAVVFSQ